MKRYNSDFAGAQASYSPGAPRPRGMDFVPWKKTGTCLSCFHSLLFQAHHIRSDDGKVLELDVPAGDMLCMQCAAEELHHYCGRLMRESTYLEVNRE